MNDERHSGEQHVPHVGKKVDGNATTASDRYREMAVQGRRSLASIKGVLAQALDGDSLTMTDALVQIEAIVEHGLEVVRPALVRIEQEIDEERGRSDA